MPTHAPDGYKDYNVTWEIDASGTYPEDAAGFALDVLQTKQNTALTFKVTDDQGNSVEVDLNENPPIVPSADLRAIAQVRYKLKYSLLRVSGEIEVDDRAPVTRETNGEVWVQAWVRVFQEDKV